MRQIFVNLPVEDVQRTRRFYTETGFEIDERFCDENAVCVVIAEGSSYAMLLDRRFFGRFLDGEPALPSQGTQVLNALTAESAEDVNATVERAVQAGGTEHFAREPVEMEGMHVRCFKDPDGHVWEVMHMDMGAVAG